MYVKDSLTAMYEEGKQTVRRPAGLRNLGICHLCQFHELRSPCSFLAVLD